MKIQYIKQEFNPKQFEASIGTLSNKISGYKHIDSSLTVYLSSIITPEEKVQIDNFVSAHVPVAEYELRIYRILPKTLNPLISDFSILGFRKEAPHYDRGRKTSAKYMCVNSDEVIVEKIFTDVRDTNTDKLLSLEVCFKWYDENNQVALEKTEIAKNYNKAEAETEERKRRERAIDFLMSEVRDTPMEQYMDTLMTHYETEINHYKNKNSSEFQNSINNEQNTSIISILDIRVPFTSDNNFTVPVRESILYQIHALSEQDLINSLQPAN